MLNFVLAGANKTSPTLIFSDEKGIVLIVPVPSVTTNKDGPAIAGNLVEVPSGRSQWSTSNSSNGGRYLFVLPSLPSTLKPLRILGRP